MKLRLHTMLRRHTVSIIIFTVALSLRLGLFLFVQPWRQDVVEHEIIVDDAVCYQRLALNLLEAGVYSNAEGPPFARHMYRTPMYPFMLTAVYYIVGIEPYAAIIVQLIMSAGICIVLYRLGLMLFGPAVARIAAVLLAVDHSQIFYANQLLSETLFTFLFLVHIFWFFSFLLKPRNRHLVYAGFFLGFSVLCRPVAVYYIVIAVTVVIIRSINSLRAALTHGALFTGVLVLSLGPWLVRNYALSGGGVFISEMQGIALSWYTGSIEERLQRTAGSPDQAVHRDVMIDDGVEERANTGRVLSVIAREAIEYTGKVGLFFVMPAGGEGAYARQLDVAPRQWDRDDFLEKPWQLVQDAARTMPSRQWAIIIYSTVWMLFVNTAALFGIRFSRELKERRYIAVLLAVIIYFALMTGAAFAARFRIPVMPYLMLLAGLGLTRRWASEKEAPTLYRQSTSAFLRAVHLRC